MNQPTPETDAAEFNCEDEFGKLCCHVDADFARKLERDLAESKKDLLQANKLLSDQSQHIAKADSIIDELDQLRNVADELANQLEAFSYGEADHQGSEIARALFAFNQLPHVKERNKQ